MSTRKLHGEHMLTDAGRVEWVSRNAHASALATVMAVSVLIPIGLSMWWKRRLDMRDRQRLEAQTAKLFTAEGGAAK